MEAPTAVRIVHVGEILKQEPLMIFNHSSVGQLFMY